MLDTLYVRRVLLNRDAVLAWASRIDPTLDIVKDEELHVTVAYSKRKVDWSSFKLDKYPLKIERPTTIKSLGFSSVLALSFDAPFLSERWMYFKSLGAAWDYPEYVPHVTFAKGRTVPKGVVGYFGPLLFGPEEAKPIKVKKREPVRTPF